MDNDTDRCYNGRRRENIRSKVLVSKERRITKLRVIKRDGRTVEYDRNKILIAIRKANAEVDPFERASDDMIGGIIAGIENMKRHHAGGRYSGYY